MRAWGLMAVALGGLAMAQDLPVASAAGEEARIALSHGDYMTAHRRVEAAIAAAAAKRPDYYTVAMWQQITPMLTGELPLDGLSRFNRPVTPDPADAARVRAATARPAIAEIVRRAAATRIVILNEQHDDPRDRAFALEVARALRPLGYRYLAAEDFAVGDDPAHAASTRDLIRDGFVRRDTGYYLNDPVFAGYVRTALRLGYAPVAYESTEAQNARGPVRQAREDGEAANLQAFLARTPGAKLLIHVGHGHVIETPLAGGEGRPTLMMAGRLKQLTGIDPLTIDQQTMSDLQPAMRDAYPVAAAKVGGRSGILFAGGQPLLLGPANTDIQVVHPARAYAHGRPTWLATLGGRPVAVPPAMLPVRGERLIQAFAADAPADAVPLDQVLVTAGSPAPMLMLPPRVRVRFAMLD